MADQSNKDTDDIFIMNFIYPNVRSIFAPLQSLDQIKDDCFIVLDTNVLLTRGHFQIGKKSGKLTPDEASSLVKGVSR